MPRQALGQGSGAAVIAAQRAFLRHVSPDNKHSSTKRESKTSRNLQRDLVNNSHSPPSPMKQQIQSARPINHGHSRRCSSSSTDISISGMHHTIATAVSIASFKTGASSRSECSSHTSNGSSFVYVRDFPTKSAPLPRWESYYVEDDAANYDPLRDPDRYLKPHTLRRCDKDKPVSWKDIKKVATRLKAKATSIMNNKYSDCL